MHSAVLLLLLAIAGVAAQNNATEPVGNVTDVTEPPVVNGTETESPTPVPVMNVTETSAPTPALNFTETSAPTPSLNSTETSAPSPAPNATETLAPVIAETLAPVIPAPVPDCYSNLTVIQELVNAKNTFVRETYILCPNTIFPIGFANSDGSCCVDGTSPLQLRANTRYKCGEDGSSKNNCTLTGGQFQLLSTLASFNFENKVAIVLEGITFEDGGNAGALLVAPGDVTFIDCVFRNHKNVGAVSMLFYISPEDNRKMAQINAMEDKNAQLGHTMNYYANLLEDPEAMAEYRADAHRSLGEHEQRELQSPVVLTRQIVTFDRCLFAGNTYGQKTLATNYGVIGAETNTNDVFVNDCIFELNDFGDQSIVGESFAIRIQEGSTLNLTNTCFYKNDFLGRGTVVVEIEADFIQSRNYGTLDSDLECQFASVGNEDNSKCIEYSSSTCVADISSGVPMTPNNTPNPAPVAVPTPTATGPTPTSGSSSLQYCWSLVGMAFSTFLLVS